jgi:hypothetical protein
LPVGPERRAALLPQRNVNVCVTPSSLNARGGCALTAQSVLSGVTWGVGVGPPETVGRGVGVEVGPGVGVYVGTTVGVFVGLGVGVAVAMAAPGIHEDVRPET